MKAFIVCRAAGEDWFIDHYAPNNGGYQRPCSECGAPVWVSPSVQRMLVIAAHPIVCNHCGLKLAAQADMLGVGPVPGCLEEAEKVAAARTEAN